MLWGILLFILVISAITALTNYNNKYNGKQPINAGVIYIKLIIRLYRRLISI